MLYGKCSRSVKREAMPRVLSDLIGPFNGLTVTKSAAEGGRYILGFGWAPYHASAGAGK